MMMNQSRSRSRSTSTSNSSEEVKPSVTLSHVVHPSCRSLSRPGDTTLTNIQRDRLCPSVGCFPPCPCRAINSTGGQPSPPVLITASQPFPFSVRTPRGGNAGPLSPASPRVSLDLQLRSVQPIVQRTPVRDNPLKPLLTLPCH